MEGGDESLGLSKQIQMSRSHPEGLSHKLFLMALKCGVIHRNVLSPAPMHPSRPLFLWCKAGHAIPHNWHDVHTQCCHSQCACTVKRLHECSRATWHNVLRCVQRINSGSVGGETNLWRACCISSEEIFSDSGKLLVVGMKRIWEGGDRVFIQRGWGVQQAWDSGRKK